MAKTLSSFAETAVDNPHVDLVRLLKIEFTGASPTLTVYLCDRTWGAAGSVCEFNGQIYEPMVMSWGTATRGRIGVPDYETEPGEFSVTIDNSVPVAGYTRFTAIFADYKPQWSTVTESYIFNGATSPPDEIDSFKGYIEDVLDMSPQQITLAVSSFELGLSEKFSHTIVDTTTYSGADPDHVGKMVPQVYGRARRVPAIAADAGGKTSLVGDITYDTPTDSGTLEVTDATTLPSSGAFTIQIDEEQIRIASRSGNTLTLASSDARGYNNTTDADHKAGADVWEIQSAYVYILADHPVDAVDDIYVDGIRQEATGSPPDFATYTGKGSDEYTGYADKAVAVFTVRPKLERQVNLDSTTLGVTDSGHTHNVGGGGTSTLTAHFEANAAWRSTVENPSYLYDDDTGTSSRFYGTTGQQPGRAVYRTTDLSGTSGTPLRYRYVVKKGTMNSQKFRVYGLSSNWITSSTGNETEQSSWITLPTQTWAYVNSKLQETNWLQNRCRIERYDQNSNDCYCQEFEIEIEYIASASPTDTGYAAADITGDINSTAEVVIGRQVAADLQGRIDDGSGTYTGSANALIERPGHIIKHLLIACCGLTASEIDATAYSAADTYYSANSYRLAVPILQKPNIRELVNRICAHCRTLQYWEAGVHHIKNVPTLDYTKLLLHFENNLTDSSPTGHTLTAVNAPSYDSTNEKIGSYAIDFESGSSQYVYAPAHSDFVFGTNLFSLEGYFRFESFPALGARPLIWLRKDGSNFIQLGYYYSDGVGNRLQAAVRVSGTYHVNILASGLSMSVDTWYHIAFVRGYGNDPDQFALFLDGTVLDTASSSVDIPDFESPLYIGYDGYSGEYMDGLVDEVRIINGDTAFVDDFTPTTEAYADPEAPPSADHEIEAGRIDLDQFYISYTPRSAIRNDISVTYQRDWSGHTDNIEAEQAIVTSEDTTSQGAYGTLADSYSLPYIIDSAVAQDVADWMIDERKDPRLTVEFSGGYWLSDIERGDIISFTESEGGDDDYLDEALLGLISYDTDLFRVVDVIHRPDNSIQITAVKL